MIYFEKIVPDTIAIALEIVNSNPEYNCMENGSPVRIFDDVKSEFLNPETDSFFIKIDKDYIGLIDFLHKNSNDGFPWIGLLMIHGDQHSQGYGAKSYQVFEEKLKEFNFDSIRLGVLQTNQRAKGFWTRMGYKFVTTKLWNNKKVDVYEKRVN
jgi:GNAT superfamily N-acetyltransferase